MRALAEFIMRSRGSALLVATLSTATSLFFWVGAAAVGLVTLRRGARDGAVILMWAALPAIAVLYLLGEILPVANLVGVFVAAVMLRQTVSLAFTLTLVPALGLVLGAVLVTVAADYLEFLVQVFAEVVSEFERNLTGPEGGPVQLASPSSAFISGGLVLMQTIAVAASLLMARWWQALLYNPGGFQTEFHALRLDSRAAAALFLGAGYLMSRGEELTLWGMALLVPLALSGLGLVHFASSKLHNGRRWLWLTYGALLLVGPVKFLLALVAVIDSFIDVRTRVQSRQK